MDLTGLDAFHDGVLLAIELDVAAWTLTIRLAAYPEPVHTPERIFVTVRFEKVRAFATTTDIEQLAIHASAGNVSHWIPAKGANTLSLAFGAITFHAEDFTIDIGGPAPAPGYYWPPDDEG